MAEVQAQNGTRKRKLQLRLDDGSVVGSVESLLGNGGSGAVLLDFEAACRTGRAGKAEVERLDKLINTFQSKVNGYHGIPRSELKSRNPYTQDVQRAIKRQRSLANGEIAAAFASPEHTQHPAVPSVNFLGKCREVLHRVYHAIDSQGYIFALPARDVFYRPVSETFPNIAGDYYRKIARPVTLREIEHRINTDSYSNALQFADDFRQLVNNCKLYNPMADDPVRVACLKMSEVFEQQWIASGLCAEASRQKRATAGIAAPKFEPEEYDMQAPKRSEDKRDELRRMQSHEVSSYREEEVDQHEIPQEILAEVAEKLQELEQANLEVALGKFNDGVVQHDNDGEVELDLEKVDYTSLMEVDAYIREVLGLPPREQQQNQPRQNQQEATAAAATETLDASEDAGRKRNRGTVKVDQVKSWKGLGT
eukprot:GHUV01021139.1.p1 GENE.GHUV01021139.1~~GHUV01021139.1.p1  ORF type:complete len:423 (+),score=99.73 GHUV01021139.1:240-1508(+)